MAFTKFTGTFTNGSSTVTNVTILRGKLSYFASGTRIVVDSDPVKAEIEAIAAPSNSEITLADTWDFATGVYTCTANMTSEGVRDAVQKIREYIGRIQAEQAALTRLYDSTAEGIAGTVSGEYFNVITPSDPDVYSQLYLNDLGVAVLQGEMPTSLAIEAAQAAAELSEDAAAASETAAANSATIASTKATEASDSAAEALASEIAAQAAQAATEQIFDQFGDQYLGAKASDPTVDNDGDPLTEGDIYFNTTDNVLKFYTGTVWVAPEDIATTAAAAALASEQAAALSEAAAATSETNAASSATSAAASATAASGSASDAAASEAAALASEQAAATSETNAAGSATAAAASATAAAGSASDANDSAIAAAASESAAATSATNAATSATNAAASATASAASATDSANSASSASASASNAATSATNAASSATAAANSATAAETAEDNALASYNSFIEKYYGAYASEPTVDPLGNPMDQGDLYFNTGDNTLYIFNGTNWQRASTTIEGIYDVSEYTNVAGQTTFNLVYDVGLVQVLYNGVQLAEGDFTATDNATVVLGTAVADAADIITIIRWGAVTESSVIVEAPTASTAVKRTSTGAVRAADGVNADEVVTKSQLDLKVDDSQLATSATANSVAQRTSDGSINAANVYASGNLGVGTASPSALGKVINVEGGGGGASLALDGGDNFAVMYAGPTADDPTALISNTGFKFATAAAKDATGFSEKVRIDSSGDVGIGTSSPSQRLSVEGGSIKLNNNNAVGAYYLWLNKKEGYDGGILLQRDNTLDWQIVNHTAGNLGFYSYGASSYVFNIARATGHVGIGTSTPAARLDLGVGSGAVGLTQTDSKHKIVTSGHVVGTEYHYGDGIIYGYNYANAIGFNINAISAVPIIFHTSNTERMRITSSGTVLVGTTSGSFGAKITARNETSYTFESRRTGTGSEGQIVFVNGNGAVGSIFTNGSSTAYNTSSDYRLKEDWQPMDCACDRVMQLNPVNFAWKADGKRVDGFLAHELQEIIPEAVTGEKDETRIEEYEVEPAVYEDVVIPAEFDEDGNEISPERTEQRLVSEAVMGEREVPVYQGIDQSKIVPLLTASLQEALRTIKAQGSMIEALEQRITALEG